MKSIHWNIPFKSVKGDSYLLWIYDDGYSGNQVRLQAGQVPFTTEENTDTDFFSPVRGSTGSISIIDPDGTIMRSLLPDNNTSRPVRLMKFVYGVPQFVWQGFLTCNTYSQGYTNRPQEVSLQVASLLDAADSISAKQSDFSGLMTVRQIIHMCVAAIKDEFGRPAEEELISTIYFPRADWRILYYWINTSIFFEEKEINNENKTTYITVGKSIKEILNIICTFMGWCVRECPNRVLSFQRMNDQNSSDYLYISYADFADGNKSLGTYLHGGTKTVVGLNDILYRGTDHEIETQEGAKSVEVVAKIEKYNTTILQLPECPTHSLAVNPSSRHQQWGEIHANTDDEFNSNLAFRMIQATGTFSNYMQSNTLVVLVQSNYSDYDNSIFWKDNGLQYNYEHFIDDNRESSLSTTLYATSFLTYWRDGENELRSGLMVCGFPKRLFRSYGGVLTAHTWNTYISLTEDNYLFKQRATLPIIVTNGYIVINMDALAFADAKKMNCTVQGVGGDLVIKLAIALNVGGKWVTKNGSNYSWSNSFSFFEIEFKKEDENSELFKTVGNWSESLGVDESEGIFIPVQSTISGDVSIRIYHQIDGIGVSGSVVSSLFDILINSISVRYVEQSGELINDRRENRYYQLLYTNFRREISIISVLATDMNNVDSPSILMYTSNDKMRYMTYSYPSGDATERPEKDLLARLAKYYKKRRSTIQLEVEHINDSLPTTRVIADGIPCEPIAESRDYQLDKTTVTLMEESANSE